MDRYGHPLERVQDREAVVALEARRVRMLQGKAATERGRQETGRTQSRGPSGSKVGPISLKACIGEC
jgi:hypothetical protein